MGEPQSTLKDGSSYEFTAPVHGASQRRSFNEVAFAPLEKLIKTIRSLYGHASHFATAFPLVSSALRHNDRLVPHLIRFSIEEVFRYIALPLRITYASDLRLADQLRGQERIMRICHLKGATMYVNLPGGAGLYNGQTFSDSNIDLRFLHPKQNPYPQFGSTFVPNLSVIDALMFNGPAQLRALLRQYCLLPT